MNEDTLKLIFKKMENKLKELMGEEQYADFAKEVAREAFRDAVEKLPDNDFKRFILDNFTTLTR